MVQSRRGGHGGKHSAVGKKASSSKTPNPSDSEMSVSDAHTVKDDVRSWSSLSDSNDDGSSDGDGDDEPEDSTAKEPWNAAGIKSFDVAPSSIAVCPSCGGKILKGTYRLDYRKAGSRAISRIRDGTILLAQQTSPRRPEIATDLLCSGGFVVT